VDGAVDLIVPSDPKKPDSDGLRMVERGDGVFSNRAAVLGGWRGGWRGI